MEKSSSNKEKTPQFFHHLKKMFQILWYMQQAQISVYRFFFECTNILKNSSAVLASLLALGKQKNLQGAPEL